MPRLTYRQRFRVYRLDQDENSPEDWVLTVESLAASVTQLNPASVLAGGSLYSPAPTHRGVAAYSEELEGGRDRRLLVAANDLREQYLLLDTRELRGPRAGHGELLLILHKQTPPVSNLAVS